MGSAQMSKSFLVLFFKKELLPSCSLTRNAAKRGVSRGLSLG
jgi:hypothetical protein